MQHFKILRQKQFSVTMHQTSIMRGIVYWSALLLLETVFYLNKLFTNTVMGGK